MAAPEGEGADTLGAGSSPAVSLQLSEPRVPHLGNKLQLPRQLSLLLFALVTPPCFERFLTAKL